MSDARNQHDYASMYDAYWSREDRWESDSFDDARALATGILSSCGEGSVLDVGCGMGTLVRALLELGVDAHGVDCATRPVEEARKEHPDRFRVAGALALPFADDSFDTVVSTDVMEHLAPNDVGPALREMARVARSAVYLRIATAADRDGEWHLTVRDGEWWRRQAVSAGLRMLEDTGHVHEPSPEWHVTLVAEPIAGSSSLIARRHAGAIARSLVSAFGPVPVIAPQKEVPLLRALRRLGVETIADPADAGLRSACRVVVWGGESDPSSSWFAGVDRVAVVTPGAVGEGLYPVATAQDFGSHPLAGRVEAQSQHESAGSLRVLLFERGASLDEHERALLPRVLWAARRRDTALDLAGGGWAAAFHANTRTSRTIKEDGALDPRSVDLIHARRGFLDDTEGAKRVLLALRPGGRVLLLCGGDPSGIIARGTEAGLLLERGFAVTSLDESVVIRPGVRAPSDCRASALVFIKPPAGERAPAPRDPALPAVPVSEDFHVGETSRDYANGWITRAIVARGLRSPEARAIVPMAESVLEESTPGSADEGAALCVLAYRAIESSASDDKLRSIAEKLVAFDTDVAQTAHAKRWRISCRFVRGLILLTLGDRDAAERAMLACAALDPLVFSPLLASKAVDALWHAGLIAVTDGRPGDARQHWRHAIAETERALKADWLNLVGDPDDPLPFGFTDLQDLAAAADRCVRALGCVELWADRPAVAFAQSMGDPDELAPPRSEAQALRASLSRSRAGIEAVRAHLSRLEEAREHFRLRAVTAEDRAARAESKLADLRVRFGTLREHTERLKDARDWHMRRSERARAVLEALGHDPDVPASEEKVAQETPSAADSGVERSKDETSAGGTA